MKVYGVFKTMHRDNGWTLLDLYESKEDAIYRAKMMAKLECAYSNKNYKIVESEDHDLLIDICWNDWERTRSGDPRHEGRDFMIKVVTIYVLPKGTILDMVDVN